MLKKIAPPPTGSKMTKKVVDRKKINRAFSLMGEAGLIAKQDFMCCKMCATVNLAVLSAQAVMRGEACLGFAYYDALDEDSRKNGQNFWIGFGPSMDEDLKLSLPFEEIAEIICKCLAEAKVPFRWSDRSERIEIIQDPNEQDQRSYGTGGNDLVN